jgi:hypothetical protein
MFSFYLIITTQNGFCVNVFLENIQVWGYLEETMEVALQPRLWRAVTQAVTSQGLTYGT